MPNTGSKGYQALGEFKEAGTLEVQVDNEIAIQGLPALPTARASRAGAKSWEIIFLPLLWK